MPEIFADALTAAERKNLKEDDFALPAKRMFPIQNKTHIKMAWDMVDRAKGLTDEERASSRKNILAAAKKSGIDTAEWGKSAMTDSVIAQMEVMLDSNKTEDADKLPPGIIMRVRNKGTRANVINNHNRLYPGNVLMDSIDAANELYVKTGSMIMESPHPRAITDAKGNVKFESNLDNQAARIIKLWMDSDGWAWFDSDIFDTTKGRNIAALIRAGVPVGVSMRAAGSMVKKIINDSYVAVSTAMDLRTFDYVPDPATEGCGTAGVLIADSQMGVIMDGLQFNDPICPIDGKLLNPIDPDQDNDVDFWECPECKSRYDVFNGIQVTTSSNQNLYRRWDSPNYGADRAAANPSATLDSQTNQGDDVEVTQDEISKMIADSIASATAPFKVILDQQANDRVVQEQRTEAVAFLDSKFEEIKTKYSAPVLEAVRKAVGEPKTKDQAAIVLDSVLDIAGQVSANEFLSALGFSPTNGAQGQSRVQVSNEPKPWQPVVDSMLQEFDRIDAEKGTVHDPELRKMNKGLVDKIVAKFEGKDNGFQVMKDSMEKVEALLDSGASITTAQLLNQPTIQTAILIQKFQDLEATQFMMSDVFEGSEWRIPSETFVGSDVIDPATLLYDITIAENSPINEAIVNVIWASFIPQPRRNAIALSSDAMRAMETGPLKYNAPARAIYHIGREAARKIDNYAYWDMAVSADEYKPKAVATESVTVTAVSNGTNVAFHGQLNPITGAGVGYQPIVRPRKKQVITANGSVQLVTTNAIVCTVGGGSALVLGGLDTSGNIIGGDFAINFETGDIYFKTGLGIVVGGTPVYPVVSYSASTNYDIWHTTMGSGYTKQEEWFNTLLMQLSDSAAIMGSSPRYNAPNLAMFSLNSATYVRNAQIFYKLAQPPGTSLTPTKNFFGQRDEIDLFKLNAPWILGDGRILLHQKNATKYGIQTPYKIEGPINKQDITTGKLLPVKAWYGEEFSCICTPQVIDANGVVLNPVSRTIRLIP